jgi:hypothetical protein
LEREKLEGELQEEKKALNDKLKEQERKIVNLSTMVISSAGDDFNQPYQKVCWRGGYALMLIRRDPTIRFIARLFYPLF